MRSLIVSVLLTASALAQDPAASLDGLLNDAWTKGVGHTYAIYSGKSHVPMDPAARQAFPQRMLDLAENPNVAGIILQKAKMEYYPKSHLPGPQEFDGAFFVHFVRADSKGDSITERIYIDVHPDHAAEVMGFVVREIMARPGIVSTKVGGPSVVETRADSMLIYARSLADVDWALDRLSEYQTTYRDHFLSKVPAATRPRAGLTGVSTAAQPARQSDSFGSYLARTAQAAMTQQPPPANFADFRKRVRELLTTDGVDPDHPDRLTRRP